MTEEFGDQSLDGFAPGGIGQGHGADSTAGVSDPVPLNVWRLMSISSSATGTIRVATPAHHDGRAINYFRPVTGGNPREGWILAHWLVAHAEDLDIQYVIFDDRLWSVHSARGQWQ